MRSEALTPGDLRAWMALCARELASQRARLDLMNVYPVPDGDTGTNLAATFEAVVGELDGAAGDMAETCAAIARGALMGARGNSGVIVSQALRGACGAWAHTPSIDGPGLAAGLGAASLTAREAVAAPVEGTILTILGSSAAAASDAGPGRDLVEVSSLALEAAQRALEATPSQLSALAEAGVVDAGGAGWVVVLDQLAALVGAVRAAPIPAPRPRAGRLDALEGPRFEVALLLDGSTDAAHELRRRWEASGTSVVVGGSDGLWTCHVHTDDPDGAVAMAEELGGVRDVELADLRSQVANGGSEPPASEPRGAGTGEGGG